MKWLETVLILKKDNDMYCCKQTEKGKMYSNHLLKTINNRKKLQKKTKEPINIIFILQKKKIKKCLLEKYLDLSCLNS